MLFSLAMASSRLRSTSSSRSCRDTAAASTASRALVVASTNFCTISALASAAPAWDCSFSAMSTVAWATSMACVASSYGAPIFLFLTTSCCTWLRNTVMQLSASAFASASSAACALAFCRRTPAVAALARSMAVGMLCTASTYRSAALGLRTGSAGTKAAIFSTSASMMSASLGGCSSSCIAKICARRCSKSFRAMLTDARSRLAS